MHSAQLLDEYSVNNDALVVEYAQSSVSSQKFANATAPGREFDRASGDNVGADAPGRTLGPVVGIVGGVDFGGAGVVDLVVGAVVGGVDVGALLGLPEVVEVQPAMSVATSAKAAIRPLPIAQSFP